MYKPSANPIVEELCKSYRERSYNLSCLKAIKTPEGTRKCAWCVEGVLTHGNQKYCTQDCSNSAMAWAYPQKEDALRYLLLRQDWKCFLCKFDYKPHLDAIIARDRIMLGKDFWDPSKLPWYYFKRLKGRLPKQNRPEVDHIVPIYKGGQSLGLGNHQILCFTCHKSKTGKDLSGKRK